MDLKSFMTGSLGGFAGIIASYPFDTMKVRIQNHHSREMEGILKIFINTVKKDGFWSLYRGMSSPLVGSMFINSILFGVESNIRKNLDFDSVETQLDRYKFFGISGSIAGFVQGTLVTPIEVIKIRMQLENSNYRSSFACAKDLVLNHGGVRSLTRGLWLTICREVPGCSIYFVGFEGIADLLSNHDVTKRRLWHLLLAGGLAGCMSWLATYPIDTVKTKFQADESFVNVMHCIKHTFKTEGHYGFWRGLSVALLRAFPNNSACFATVAVLNSYFVDG